MKKIYITASPRKGSDNEKVRDEALEALSRLPNIEKGEGSSGLFGKLTRRDYAKERKL